MALPIDASTVTHGIQLAIAPVFLLTAVSGMIGAVAGRLARINVEITDLPGSLARVTACIAAQGANIDQVHHQRAFSKLTVQNAELDVTLKTRNGEHVAEIVAALQRAGFKARSNPIE